jgi:hypothetical protein
MALHAAEHSSGASILEKIQLVEIDGRVRRDALVTLDSLRSASTMPESVGVLRTALSKLEEEQRKLKGELEKLRARKR